MIILNKMSHIMLDIETLGTSSNSIILTIGAIKFKPTTPIDSIENCDTFYRRIDIESCRKVGLISEEQTVKWWNSQDSSVKFEALENQDRLPLTQVLLEFTKWFGKSVKIWGHGDDFDCVILTNAYKACNLTPPWKFWNTRDTRTLFDLARVNIKSFCQDNIHHALHDSYRQILATQESLKILNLNNIYQ